MHSAPWVSYPVGRTRNAERILLISWGIGFCAVSIACLGSPSIGWREGLLLLTALGAGLMAWVGAVRHSASADLIFDGQHWTVSGEAQIQTARASVALDLQFLLLVCLSSQSGRTRRWIWLDRNAMPARWRDLRRALYSRAAPVDPSGRAPSSIAANALKSSS